MLRLRGWLFLFASSTLLGSVVLFDSHQPIRGQDIPEKGKAAAPATPVETLPAGALVRLRSAPSRSSDQIVALAFSPDGKTLASSSSGQDRVIRLWDLLTTKEVRQLEGHMGTAWRLAFSPDGRVLASSSDDSSVRLWDVATGKEVSKLTGHQGATWFVSFTPDGKTLASSGEDLTIRIWDVASGREIRQLLGHQNGGVWPLAFGPDGRTLASGGYDGTVRIWDAVVGREVRQCAAHPSGVWPLEFASDGKTVVSAGWQDRTIRLWEVASGKERLQIKPQGGLKYIALAPDGRTLASAGEDQAVRLWDLARGSERHRFEGHGSSVQTVAFSPDGKLLASGSQDGMILLWDVAGSLKESPPVAELSANDLNERWTQLYGNDAMKAHEAVWALTANPRIAVPFLHENVKPATATAEQQRIERLIAELDDDHFVIREKATADLERIGTLAEAILRQTMQNTASLEVRRRVERLLEKLEAWITPPETLRSLRAIEVLERIATPEARQVLDKLAGGAPEAVVTQEAKASLSRLPRLTVGR